MIAVVTYLGAAVTSPVARVAVACKVVLQVLTEAAVLARGRGTLVVIQLAALPVVT